VDAALGLLGALPYQRGEHVLGSALRKWSVVASVAVVTSLASAEDLPPDLLLKSVTAEVSVLVKQSRGQLILGRTSDMNELVEHKIVPLFDFDRMTQTALGQYWRLATPAQRTALTAEFKTLLVRTYATVLGRYRDHVMEFRPLSLAPGATHATVNSVVRQATSAGTPVDYEMEKTGSGWKVCEIRLDGVKLIQNYRSTFAARVQDVGLDGLIKALSDKNRQRET
jgi:phospholipid transport system substrate-binding protein